MSAFSFNQSGYPIIYNEDKEKWEKCNFNKSHASLIRSYTKLVKGTK